MSSQNDAFPGWHATTICTVRKGGKVVIGGDGQVSLGQTVIKAMTIASEICVYTNGNLVIESIG